MFRTQDSDLIGVPGIFGEGLAHWHSVSRVLRTHWYHLTVRLTDQARSTEFVDMIEGEHRLQSMLVTQSAEREIIDVQVTTPAWMNKGAGWDMERVTKVSLGYDSDFEVCLIEVERGAIYHNSHRPDFQIDSLTDLRPIFLSSMIRSG
ncbi:MULTISPECIES: hypothetical protein [unclassified Pseudomonas]|uniref:hypothetical protein n=1 Tax=Pseudomonas TaxID=286 RepID=UPI000BFDD33D|nr:MULTISPECIES: hypothetical protein [unclassified Pseudomonas]ATN08296.1 hypothetical protein CRN80_00890 [Pseudomonas sp. FDAARGOS_380]MDQ0666647.1 hypothetical protein [Pseudomonas sp. W2I6]